MNRRSRVLYRVPILRNVSGFRNIRKREALDKATRLALFLQLDGAKCNRVL
jgi:hypothetical protein